MKTRILGALPTTGAAVTIVAPIANARKPEQLPALPRSVTLELSPDELGKPTEASS